MRADTHTLAVEQLRLGDHAFAHYADDDVRGEVPAVFAYRGLARGEKVIVMMDPAPLADDACARLAAYGGGADAARASGQLEFSSMRELIGPKQPFTALRQMGRLREETERACRRTRSLTAGGTPKSAPTTAVASILA
jgi:MEDS: MEthanogen/methylotroph, DcmR Sensory domain